MPKGKCIPKKKGKKWKAVVLDPNKYVTILSPGVVPELEGYDEVLAKAKENTEKISKVIEKEADNWPKLAKGSVKTADFVDALHKSAWPSLQKGDTVKLHTSNKPMKAKKLTAATLKKAIAVLKKHNKEYDKGFFKAYVHPESPIAKDAMDFSKDAMLYGTGVKEFKYKDQPDLQPVAPPKDTNHPSLIQLYNQTLVDKAYAEYGIKMEGKCQHCKKDVTLGYGMQVSKAFQMMLSGSIYGSPKSTKDLTETLYPESTSNTGIDEPEG